ncbi:hypothetical protein BLOT_016476, partial [Blomia tropicalis]
MLTDQKMAKYIVERKSNAERNPMLKEGLNNPDSNIDLNHLDYNSDEEEFIEFLRELEHDTSSES